MQLAFELHKTVDELLDADQTWVYKMLLDREARAIAGAPTEVDYHRRLHAILFEMNTSNGNP